MPRPIIIDTDPGQDDAIALLLALASPEQLEILGIVTVAGNVPLDKTTHNARALVELAKRPDVLVYEGCPGPLVHDLVTAEHVHGKTGLDGWDIPGIIPAAAALLVAVGLLAVVGPARRALLVDPTEALRDG